MKYTYFQFQNFKGILKQKFDFSNSSNSNVYTLVGLNESGKTTVLEAINYFAYKPETLEALELDSYEVEDIHSLIPINKRDNFNGFITVEAGIECDEEDIAQIRKAFLEKNIKMTSFSGKISYTQKYFFNNSINDPKKDKKEWTYDFKGFVGKGRKERSLNNTEALLVNELIKKRLPSILYFPNFLFEFPDRIYLDSDEPKHKFYKTIIQDVLDSLDNNTNVDDHLIKRINSNDENEQRNLRSLIGKMQKQLTKVIFEKWNQIFNKQITEAEVVLLAGTDKEGTFLEFYIEDDVDTYRILERSLGFRWFFVYIFLTQFRSSRKGFKNVCFLFDEPASNLHPSAQQELLRSFEKLPKVIYTTHSHYLINPNWLENTYVIKNEAIDYEREENYNSKNTDIRITKYREFAVKFPNQTSYFQPILEVLDYRPTNLELVPDVVITEGKNDFYMLNYFQEIIDLDQKPLKIVPGTSVSNLETLISLYLGWGRNFILLFDSDKEGLAQKLRYIELFGNVLSDRIVLYNDIDPTWVNFEIESLFMQEDLLSIQKRIYPDENKPNKKLFHRSIQELYLKKEPYSLNSETNNNMKTLIRYLKKKLK